MFDHQHAVRATKQGHASRRWLASEYAICSLCGKVDAMSYTTELLMDKQLGENEHFAAAQRNQKEVLQEESRGFEENQTDAFPIADKLLAEPAVPILARKTWLLIQARPERVYGPITPTFGLAHVDVRTLRQIQGRVDGEMSTSRINLVLHN